MIRTVVSAELPVGEQFEVRKNVIRGKAAGGDRGTSPRPRLCIVTGTHGDELEGQYVCFELARRLAERPECLTGTVEIYPALNPLGVDSIIRGFPAFDLDMNRIFPGKVDGHLAENAVFQITKDLQGADMVLDIHSSNIFLKEVMQVRVSRDSADALLPFAKMLNTDFIWIHDAVTVLESTLAHALNSGGTKTLVVEMGIGMRITRAYGERLTDGIFNLMRHLGMWHDAAPASPVTEPLVAAGEDVIFMNAESSGVIIPAVEHSAFVSAGDRLCQIVSPFEGKVLQNVTAPEDGFLFTLRTFPMVYEGSLIARIFRTKGQGA